MTQQIINIGSAPDDGTGDPTRTAFNKTNQNFTELYATAGAPVGAEYITSTADATLTAERVLTDTATVTWDRTVAGQIKANVAGYTVMAPQGRLTLQSGAPVMTTTQAAKTAIFYASYVGNQIALYNGASMVPMTFSELTVATTDTTKSPAAIGASKCNDWFIWSDAGTLRIGHGPDWTSDTVRSAGTALVMVNGILLNNAAITNGPAASRGTYVGTTRSNASSQLDWIVGGAAAGGVAGFLGVWNCYNRVDASVYVRDTTASWTDINAAYHTANNSTNNRISFVIGLQEDGIIASYSVSGVNASATAQTTIGLDSITTASSSANNTLFGGGAPYIQVASMFNAQVSIGFHFLQALEVTNGSTTTWNGNTVFGFQLRGRF